MATSGSELTRIGASIHALGIKLSISAKPPGIAVLGRGSMLAAQHVRRAMRRRGGGRR